MGWLFNSPGCWLALILFFLWLWLSGMMAWGGF